MRILNVIASVDPRHGGAIEAVRQLQKPIEARGHTWEAVSLDSPSESFVDECPTQTTALGPTKTPYAFSPLLVPWLRDHAAKYDAVVVHGLWMYHSFATWRALGKTDVPYVVYPHGMLDPYFKRAFPLKHLKKWAFWPWSDYRVLRDARAALFTCEGERILARDSFWLYKARERVVGLGTSKPLGDSQAQRAAFLARFPELGNKHLLLFLSRLHPKKGCDLLLEAWGELFASRQLPPDAHLVMAGPDSSGWQAELKKILERHGAQETVTWTGMLAGDEKWGAIHASRAFVLPSHQENFGIAVAEALACGVPTLISDKVNIWHEIEAARAGIVGTDSLSSTKETLAKWFALPDEEREAMSDAARACFAEHFEIEGAAMKLLDVLEEVRR